MPALRTKRCFTWRLVLSALAVAVVATSCTSTPAATPSSGGLTISGAGNLVVSQTVDPHPYPLPSGWRTLGPVFDLTAKNHGRKITALPHPVTLSFHVSERVPSTIAVYINGAWHTVPTKSTNDGNLTATVTHFTPYTVATSCPSSGSTSTTTEPLPGPLTRSYVTSTATSCTYTANTEPLPGPLTR